MLVSYEVQLVALATVLYLYDSLLLLYDGESVVVEHHDGWRSVQGSDSYMLAGRSPYFMNPLRPDLAVLKGRSEAPLVLRAEREFAILRQKFVPVRVAAIVELFSLFISLPFALFFGQHITLLVSAILIYGSIAASLIAIARNLDVMPLDRRQMVSLAVESLCCAPFGINILRRVTLRID